MPRRLRVLIAAALLIGGCYPGSDSEVFQRRWEADRQERIAGMKAATRQQARGEAVGGAALRVLLTGRTHEFDYQQDPLGRPGRYVEYYHFQRDSRLVFSNPPLSASPGAVNDDRWRVDGDRLCVVTAWLSPDERCFTLAVLPNGRVQYFVQEPGDQADGLLTKVTNAVFDGPPPPDGSEP